MSKKTLAQPTSPAQKQWAAMCHDRAFNDLPYKFETDRLGKIILSPITNPHSFLKSQISFQMKSLDPHGYSLISCAIETADGVKTLDVAWISKERGKPHMGGYCLPIAPDICVEVASPFTSRSEMLRKQRLYFQAGALEVWFCDKKGRMEFWDKSGSIKNSQICSDFPTVVKSGNP